MRSLSRRGLTTGANRHFCPNQFLAQNFHVCLFVRDCSLRASAWVGGLFWWPLAPGREVQHLHADLRDLLCIRHRRAQPRLPGYGDLPVGQLQPRGCPGVLQEGAQGCMNFSMCLDFARMCASVLAAHPTMSSREIMVEVRGKRIAFAVSFGWEG